jgi:hypothetical protein
LEEEKVEEGKEPRITKMYWTYWNGEKYIELEEDKKPRYYADLNLHVETKNYKDGDTVEVIIENDDRQPLFGDTLKLELTGIVSSNNIIFENVFNEYTLNIL